MSSSSTRGRGRRVTSLSMLACAVVLFVATLTSHTTHLLTVSAKELTPPVSVKNDKLRDMFMSGDVRSPGSSADDAVGFLHNLARSPNRLSKFLGADSAQRDKIVEDYVRAMIPYMVVPFTLAVIIALVAFVACCMRAVWDKCGRRQATKHYHGAEVNVYRVFFITQVAVFIILFGFGTAANIDISFSFDAIVVATDKMAEYYYRYKDLAGSFRNIAGTSELRVRQFNTTLTGNLPTEPALELMINATRALYVAVPFMSTTAGHIATFTERLLEASTAQSYAVFDAAARTDIATMNTQYTTTSDSCEPAAGVLDAFAAGRRINTSIVILSDDEVSGMYVLEPFIAPALTSPSQTAADVRSAQYWATVLSTAAAGAAPYNHTIILQNLNATSATSVEFTPARFLTMSTATRDKFIGTLEDMKQFRTNVPNVNDAHESIVDVRDRFKQAEDDIFDNRESYYRERNDFKEAVNEFDGLRLLWTNILIAAPLLFAFLGVSGCFCESGCPAMSMSMMYIPLIFFYCIMGGLLMAPALFLSDHCPVFHAAINTQLFNESISIEDMHEYFKDPALETQVVTADLYNYLACCKGDEPVVLQQLNRVDAILNENGFNMTTLRQELANVTGTPLKLHPRMEAHLDSFDEQRVALNFAAQKVRNVLTCEAISSLVEEFRNAFCEDFAGAVALSTCLYMAMAFCMMPGVIFGIRGHKRFNPENHEIPAHHKERLRRHARDKAEKQRMLRKKRDGAGKKKKPAPVDNSDAAISKLLKKHRSSGQPEGKMSNFEARVS